MPLAYQPSSADFLATRPKNFLPLLPQSLPVDPSVVGLRILPLRMSPLPTSPHSSTFLYSYHLLLNSFLLLSSSTLNFCISVSRRKASEESGSSRMAIRESIGNGPLTRHIRPRIADCSCQFSVELRRSSKYCADILSRYSSSLPKSRQASRRCWRSADWHS